MPPTPAPLPETTPEPTPAPETSAGDQLLRTVGVVGATVALIGLGSVGVSLLMGR
jgi:hypothetical protein